MKPINLKLSGLQSYRKQQEVDFTLLCDTGLFGIFGPTGSGKSSLLDAITLAMYGKVERATNGTQGIMNIAEDQLAVAFTFELMSAAGPKQYRVERRFKRVNEVSISNTVSRFIEITAEGEVVLADKLAEVTRQVEEIIGLTLTDFTRAVVLPQGKFAEFLTLKGSERRQMLQRLFHLEKYGDVLSSRVNSRLKETDVIVKEIAAEQQGLGDASEACVLQVTQFLQHVRQQALEERIKRQEAEVRHTQGQQVRSWMTERDVVLAELARLAKYDGSILQLEELLTRAEQASRLEPFLKEYEQSVQHAQTRSAQALETEEVRMRTQQAVEAAAEAWQYIQQRQLEREPQLIIRQEHLEQAIELERECTDMQQQTAALGQRHESSGAELQSLLTQVAQIETQAEKALARQQELQQQLKLKVISPEWRDTLMRGDRLRLTWSNLDRQHAQAIRDVTQFEQQQAGIEQRQLDQQEVRKQLQSEQQQLIEQVLAYMEQGMMLDRLLMGGTERLTHEMNHLRERQRELEISQLSRRLAEQLVHGEPCPVCGSTVHAISVHAQPAAEQIADVGGAADVFNELDKLTGVSERWSTLSQQQRHLRHRLETLLESIQGDAALDQQSVESEIASAVSNEDGEANAIEGAGSTLWNARYQEYAQQSETMTKLIVQMEHEAKRLRLQWNETDQQSAALQAEHTASKERLVQQRNLTDRLTQESTVIQLEWEVSLPQIQREQLDELLADLQATEEQQRDIQARLERSVPYIEETNQQLITLKQRQNSAEKDMVLLTAQLDGKRQLLQEKQARLQQVLGTEAGNAQEQLAHTQHELADLRFNVERLTTVLEQARREQQTAEQALAAARSAAKSADERAASATEVWESACKQSVFANAAELQAAVLSSAQRVAHDQQIKEHRDQQRKQQLQLQRLEEQLQGEVISDEAWEACVTALRQLQEADEQAVRTVAKAERDLEDLQQRAARWAVLEQQRVVQQQLLQRLSQLQTVFRGNAFVEYIAEEQLIQVSHAASERLRFLTKQRYALEVDSVGNFVVRDDTNGGVRRPVTTLSGGETFLTSLALALALSAQIQLQGKYPLQFFFLDEGFGTLDPELLDTVITALEKLHVDQLTVGIISHVPELRARMARKLVVTPAGQLGEGSTLALEGI